MSEKKKCYHCDEWLTEAQRKTHDCWTTTEENLTQNLSEDLLEAWQRLRETAVEFGEQRVYASHKSIMFSRKHCYFFVRPQKSFLEVCFFMGKPIRAAQIRKVQQTSRTKFAHWVRICHRDEVESPITDWLREAYVSVEPPQERGTRAKARKVNQKVRRKAQRKKVKNRHPKATRKTR